ncbi:MAG TPA: SH3 domain-containing protein [Terriglobales bacterium]|jgi:outer membrane protein assembly factor BamD (BamD/ComL family)
MKAIFMCAARLSIAASLLLTGCNNPENDFEKAKQVNTEQGYQDFIKRHPDSPLVTQAQTDLEKVAFEAAKRAATAAALETFLSRFPKSSLTEQAQVVLENLQYEQTKRTGTVEAYETLLRRFSAGQHATNAKSELEEIEFTLADKAKSMSAWQAFLKKYPQSLHKENATSAICDLRFKQAVEENTTAALEAFLKDFPESNHAHDALERLASLILKGLVKAEKISDYESFLSRFGSTAVAGEVSNSLARLEYPSAVKENTIEAYESFLRKFSNSELTDDVKKRLEPQLEERDWNAALLRNDVAAYRTFSQQHVTNSRIKLLSGNAEVSLKVPKFTQTSSLKILDNPPITQVIVHYSDGTEETFSEQQVKHGAQPKSRALVKLTSDLVQMFVMPIEDAIKFEIVKVANGEPKLENEGRFTNVTVVASANRGNPDIIAMDWSPRPKMAHVGNEFHFDSSGTNEVRNPIATGAATAGDNTSSSGRSHAWVLGLFLDSAHKTVLSNQLKVRSGPGTDYPVMRILKKGDEVKELRSEGGWVEIARPW